METKLALSKIQPSQTNPRKYFEPKALAELAESIKKHGVLQPILVREVPKSAGITKLTAIYEIVAGERRFKASQAAGLKEIPAVVMTLTDTEAVEIQVVENLQRADLHPMEEAEGYEFLMKQHGYAGADAIAAKIGKSRSYVYGRLKLCALTPEIKEAFLKDTITPSVALLLARIPESLQAKASKTVLEGKYGEGPLPYRHAVEFLKEHYTLTLAGAPFDTKNEILTLPGVPSCAKCPKRTGNEPELFADIKSADVCTDPDCFKQKKEEAWADKTAKFKQSGYTILPASKCRGMFYGSILNTRNHYELSEVCDHDKKKRTYRELLPNLKNEEILIACDEKGKPRQLVKRSVADVLMHEAGYKFMERVVEPRPKEKTPEEKEAEERKEKAQQAALLAAASQIVTKIEAGAKSLYILQCAAREVFDASETSGFIVGRRGAKTTTGFQKTITSMSMEQCLGVIFECFMGKLCWNWNGLDAAAFKKVCKEFGVDGGLLLKQALNAAEEKTKK